MRQLSFLLAKRCLLRSDVPVGAGQLVFEARDALVVGLPFLGTLDCCRVLIILELGARLRQLAVERLHFGDAVGEPLLQASIVRLDRGQPHALDMMRRLQLRERGLGPFQLPGQRRMGRCERLLFGAQRIIVRLLHLFEVLRELALHVLVQAFHRLQQRRRQASLGRGDRLLLLRFPALQERRDRALAAGAMASSSRLSGSDVDADRAQDARRDRAHAWQAEKES
jgi:hypothetical protein